MRLHSLEATAFGPFSGTVTVDFDRLSEAGPVPALRRDRRRQDQRARRRLLRALRRRARRPEPGQAAARRPGRARPRPAVTLEATLSGRRFRITRTPAWQRPKRRGTGTTPAQASVLVQERARGGWTTLATRLDEAGLLVSGLVGMNLTQFTQVAMLPQGRFQAFLRAQSEDRHRLLHQLFRTGRFESVEGWLRDRRVRLKRDVESAHRTLADLVSRTSEAVAMSLPEGWDVARPRRAGRSTARSRPGPRSSPHDARERSARTVDEVGRGRRRRSSARARRSTPPGGWPPARPRSPPRAPGGAELEAAPARGRRGSGRPSRPRAAPPPCARSPGSPPAPRPRWTSARLAADGVDETTARRSRAGRAGGRRGAPPRPGAALPRESEVAGLTASIEVDEARGSSGCRCWSAPPTLRTLVADRRGARRPAARARRVRARRTSQAQARRASTSARRCSTSAGRRIEGMAAELAGALAVGADCPVCGSVDHPHPAVPDPRRPRRRAPRRPPTKALDDAKSLEHLRATEQRDLETRLEATAERRRPPAGRPARRARGLDAPDRDLDAEALAAEQRPADDRARPQARAPRRGAGRGRRRARRPRGRRPRRPWSASTGPPPSAPRTAGRALDALADADAAPPGGAGRAGRGAGRGRLRDAATPPSGPR